MTRHRPNSFSKPITNHRTFHILLHYDQTTKTLVRLFLIRSKTIILKVLKSMPPLFRTLYIRTLECMYIVSTYKSVRSSTWVCFVYRPIWWRRGGHSATRAAPSTKSGSTQAVLFPRLFFSVVQQLYFHKVVPQF